MSYCTWHTYGYGICTAKLNPGADRIKALIHLAPIFEEKVNLFFQQQGVLDPTTEDYLELDQDYYCGLATIIQNVIEEAEGLKLTSCDDYDCNQYLLYQPSYPWTLSKAEMTLTEEDVRLIFARYISILSDEPLEVDYYSVENGG